MDADDATVLRDDAVYRREAQPGTLADGLGREEGLEDVRERLAVHPDAAVAHGQEDVVAHPEADVLAAVALVDPHVRRLDGQLPAHGHRVAGVDHQVHQDLVHLGGIDPHRPQVRREVDAEVDVLTDQPPERLVRLRQELAQVQGDGAPRSACARRRAAGG